MGEKNSSKVVFEKMVHLEMMIRMKHGVFLLTIFMSCCPNSAAILGNALLNFFRSRSRVFSETEIVVRAQIDTVRRFIQKTGEGVKMKT